MWLCAACVPSWRWCARCVLHVCVLLACTNTCLPLLLPFLPPPSFSGTSVDWTKGFSGKAEDQTAAVTSGEVLTFVWTGNHNVFLMKDKAAFDACDFSAAIELGSESPVLHTTGTATAYFACQIGTHCVSGQKLSAVATTPEDSGVPGDKAKADADKAAADKAAKDAADKAAASKAIADKAVADQAVADKAAADAKAKADASGGASDIAAAAAAKAKADNAAAAAKAATDVASTDSAAAKVAADDASALGGSGVDGGAIAGVVVVLLLVIGLVVGLYLFRARLTSIVKKGSQGKGPVPQSPAGAAPASWQEDTPTTDDPLPPGWEAAVDPESGATYYYDDAGTTSWTRPGGRPKTEVALSPVSMQTNPNGTFF